jgi:aryl-alcohol dehydrogenase-like predicted oxidoreductase
MANYISLGRTGIQVSPLCLGTMNFGGATDQAESEKILDAAIDHGINFIDTANIYGKGRSEETVGAALANNQKRRRIILATKVHVSMDNTDPNASNNHRRHIIEQCEASLKRLRTDVIDLYYIHRPSTEIPIDETLRALDDLVRTGKVRYLGTSDFAAWKIIESLWVSKEYGLNRFVCEQAAYHLLDRRAERELLPMTQSYGLAVMAWSPLAGGFLTGKYDRDAKRPTDARFAESDKPNDWNDRHFVSDAFTVVETVNELAHEKGCSAAQFALAWCLHQPGITGPVLGPKTLAQFEEQFGALQIAVTDEDKQRIDEVSAPGKVIVPYYLDDAFSDLRPHRFRW